MTPDNHFSLALAWNHETADVVAYSAPHGDQPAVFSEWATSDIPFDPTNPTKVLRDLLLAWIEAAF